jgi:menaquinone-specific isochorismate synthase
MQFELTQNEPTNILRSSFGLFAGPKPEDPVFLGLLDAPSSIEPDHGFFSPPFFFNERDPHWYPIRNVVSLPKREFVEILESMNPEGFKEIYEFDFREKHRFIEAVMELKNHFKSTPLRKAVPYARARARRAPSRENQFHMVLSALHQQTRSGGYVFACANESGGLLGLTPELLFQKQDDQIHTMALAGTRLDEPGAAEKILSDPKELIEHQWVVDGIRECIQDLGKLHLDPVRVSRSGRLLHLETKMKLENASAQFAQIVQRLHPTPALGGYPKQAAVDWLARYNEASPRSRFGAPFGFKSGELEICLVAIRAVEWSHVDDFSDMTAGCGITERSDPDAEWREVQNKWKSICASLGQKECGQKEFK